VSKRAVLLSAAMIAALCPGRAAAQAMLESQPPRVSVRITGPLGINGTTPLPIDHFPEGQYQLQVDGIGVAAVRGNLLATPSGQISASPYAGFEALFMPPGFLHTTRKERARGFLFSGSSAASGAALIVKQADLGRAEDDLRRAQSAVDIVTSPEEAERVALWLATSSEKVDDQKEIRNLWIAYWGAIWVGAAVEAWLLTPRPKLSSQGDSSYLLRVPKAGGLSAGLRSVLVPGAGQRSLGSYHRANAFSAAVLFFGAATLVAYEEFLDAKRGQDDAQRRLQLATTQEEVQERRIALAEAANRADDRSVIRWTALGLTVGVYLWNIVDAFSRGRELSTPPGFDVSVAPSPEGVQAALRWRLP
jgi:hypothetical protein